MPTARPTYNIDGKQSVETGGEWVVVDERAGDVSGDAEVGERRIEGGDGPRSVGVPNASSVREPFLSVSLCGAKGRMLLGFAAFVSWTNLLMCFEGLLRDSVIYGGGVVHDPFLVGACVAAALLLVAAALWRPGLREGKEPRPFRSPHRFLAAVAVLGAVCAAAAVVVSVVAVSNGPHLWFLATLLGVGAGCFIACFTLAWGSAISAFDMRDILFVLCAALCLQWAPFVPVVFFGPAAKAVLAGALPLLSWACLRGLDNGGAEEGLPRVAAAAAGKGPEHRDGVLPRLCGALFCFAFTIEFVWTCNVVMAAEPLDESLFWLVYVCVLGAAALVMGVILGFMEHWRTYRMELFYRAAFALAVVGSVALPLSYHHLFFSYAVVYVAYALISTTMWMLAWAVMFMRKLAPRRVIGYVFGLQFLALPCGFAAAKSMQWYAVSHTGADLLPYVGFAAVAVLVVAYVFLLPERVLLLLSPRLLKLSHESLDDRCRDAAAAFGLTERETEIFMLLARGRDVGYIEKTLFISRNTVNTHRKNLYRKLGIHTQQELLSLIEDNLG